MRDDDHFINVKGGNRLAFDSLDIQEVLTVSLQTFCNISFNNSGIYIIIKSRKEAKYQQINSSDRWAFSYFSILVLSTLSQAASLSSIVIIDMCQGTQRVLQAKSNTERCSNWPVSAFIESLFWSARAGFDTSSFGNEASGLRQLGHESKILFY